MEPFIKADIFFFVTTIAIVLITFLLSIILVYGIYFARNIYLVSKNVKKEADLIVEMVSTVREVVEERGVSLLSMVMKFVNIFHPSDKPKRKSVRKNNK